MRISNGEVVQGFMPTWVVEAVANTPVSLMQYTAFRTSSDTNYKIMLLDGKETIETALPVGVTVITPDALHYVFTKDIKLELML